MATRESFKKLKVDVLMKLGRNLGITIPTLKKTEIISTILTHQVPVYALPPVTNQAVRFSTIAPFSGPQPSRFPHAFSKVA